VLHVVVGVPVRVDVAVVLLLQGTVRQAIVVPLLLRLLGRKYVVVFLGLRLGSNFVVAALLLVDRVVDLADFGLAALPGLDIFVSLLRVQVVLSSEVLRMLGHGQQVLQRLLVAFGSTIFSWNLVAWP
jgi:hypothetical protein